MNDGGGAGMMVGANLGAGRAADWLCLAASPSFAIMALMPNVLGAGPMNGLCPAGHGPTLSGMVPMYVLMSAFHAAPWLKLMCGRPGGARFS